VEAVAVWWIGAEAPDPGLLEEVRFHVEQTLEVEADLLASAARPQATLDARRGQHASGRILEFLAEHAPAGGKTLGLTDVDLFIPILTFVFGEAQLGGKAAVVSTARLGGDAGVADAEVFRARLVKEAIHELGHTFGLRHCGEPRCAMARSASLHHVDEKDGRLCGDCRSLLRDLRRHKGGS